MTRIGATVLLLWLVSIGLAQCAEEPEKSLAEKLRISIEVVLPERMYAGEAITAKITIVNKGDTEVKSLVDRDPVLYDRFLRLRMASEGKVIPYTRYGAMYTKPRDGSFSFLRIRPGESKTFNVNLSRVFDLSEPGKYSVSVSVEALRNEEEFFLVKGNAELMVSQPEQKN